MKNKRRQIGSRTAKGGFANEKEICKKFNSFRKDKEAKEWLAIMGYDINKVSKVEAVSKIIVPKSPEKY